MANKPMIKLLRPLLCILPSPFDPWILQVIILDKQRRHMFR